MAQEQGGQRPETVAAPWTKLFSAFRLAISPSKLLLAAAGILVMAAGWWLLAVTFYGLRSKPEWKDYEPGADNSATQQDDSWKRFKAARKSWALLHKLAGNKPLLRDAGDEANTLAEFQVIDTILTFFHRPQLIQRQDVYHLQIERRDGKKDEYALTLDDKKDASRVILNKPVNYEIVDKDKSTIRVAGILFRYEAKQAVLKDLEDYREGMKARDKLETEAQTDKAKEAAVQKAVRLAVLPEYEPYGYLRLWPWQEYRGPNPYLVVTDPTVREEYFTGVSESARRAALAREEFKAKGGLDRAGATAGPADGGGLRGFLGVQLPVLLEPLVKFFSPLVYFLSGEATFYIRFYLLLVIVWTLATWALFGGAITRMAVVQAARPTERIGLFEAVTFARSRLQSFFSAPLIPLVFLAVMTLFIIFLGFIEGVTVFFGDIFLAVFFWPLIFLFALVMGLVLVGLIGWPLMYATISAEGSDSFDALSRSYSYVFSAIWRYLAYAGTALVYGAVLVFFVGFMGSLVVYLGKWGVSQTPFLSAMNREPTYFFIHAPRSFGWRDLLLHDSPDTEMKEVIRPDGKPGKEIRLTEKYRDSFKFWNHVGAFFVTFWLFLLFLLVLGFGYSYFWCAGSIIYLLMRWQVDETDLDEIHLEEEEEPLPEMPEPAATAAPAGAPGLTMVDSPALRTGSPSGTPAAFPASPSGETHPHGSAPGSPTPSPGFEGGTPPSNP